MGGYRLVRRAGDLADVGDGGAGGVDAGVEDAHELHLRQRQHVLGRMGFSGGGGGGWCWSRGRGFGGRRRGLTLAVVRRRAASMWARWGGSRISETSLFAMANTADGLWGEREIGGLETGFFRGGCVVDSNIFCFRALWNCFGSFYMFLVNDM